MRRSALKADPDRVRAWISKKRKPLARSPLKRRSPSATPRRAGYDYEQFWFSVCTRREKDGRVRVPCVVCGSVEELDAHHVIAKQRLHRVAASLKMDMPELVELLMDKRNGISLCRRHHDLHEAASSRVRFTQLPDRSLAFARWLDSKLRTEECMLYLERIYS